MASLRLKKKAQSILEYAILVAVVVAALIATQVYLKRGYQGKLRESADQMGEQFSPGYTNTQYTTNTFTNSTEEVKEDTSTVTTIHEQTTNRTGSEKVDKMANESWFGK